MPKTNNKPLAFVAMQHDIEPAALIAALPFLGVSSLDFGPLFAVLFFAARRALI